MVNGWIVGIVACTLLGIGIGVGITYLLMWRRGHDHRAFLDASIAQISQQKSAAEERLLLQFKESFATLTQDALARNNTQFLTLAQQALTKESAQHEHALGEKHKLISQSISGLQEYLAKMAQMVKSLEQDRDQKFGQITELIKNTASQTQKLQETAHQLTTVLSGSKPRGQWGERMAEDVLRSAGMVQGVNYQKQKRMDNSRCVPDFTFFLPDNHTLNMDVKFPLDNYMYYVNATSDSDRENYQKLFFRDIRLRLKEITSKEYISQENGTIGCALMFIPNEALFTFIIEHDPNFIETALKNRVVLSSPITLMAVLAIIRQSMDQFKLTQTSHEIVAILGQFDKQWRLYVNEFDKIEDKIEGLATQYRYVKTTRTTQLDRQIKKIQALRSPQSPTTDFDDSSHLTRDNDEHVDTNIT